jgi:hypothetical protein
MRERSPEVCIMIKSNAGLRWHRATACSSGTCVEIANDGDRFLVRDSKNPQIDPFVFTRAEWEAFKAGVLAGEFDFG